jgi:hypothetical protein
MGTWGSGNLDNDYARDELDDRSAKLIKTLMRRARRKTSRQADEYDYTTLFAEFEIVFALEARKLIGGHLLPSPEAVEELKWEFIRDWAPTSMNFDRPKRTRKTVAVASCRPSIGSSAFAPSIKRKDPVEL